ncbi:MAG: dihydrolipoyllysine-residue acetyltransferase [Anaerolineae bacterium]|nr:dihydrolipoyllysine-residue acetyltransferase [Anaerolineae bacterium]
MTEFKLPELGENIQAGDVINVLVSVGDTVAPDQPVLELETDKATVEVPSSVGGVVQAIHIKPGDTIKVGQLILTLEGNGPATQPAAASQAQAETAPPEPAPAAPSSPPLQPVAEAAPSPSPQPAAPPTPVTIEFKLPDLGENIQAGDVVNVLVSVGDTIAVDQPVLELETDKATVEVPSSAAGVVKEIHVKAGDTVKVDQLVLTLEGTSPAAETASQPAPAAQPPAPEPAAEVEPEPTPEPAAPDQPEVTPLDPAAQAAPTPAFYRPDAAYSAVPAAPNVRRLAREIGIDVTQVPGSGPGGRITIADVKNYARQRHLSGAVAGPATQAVAAPLPDFSKWGQVEREPMSNIRRKTAEHLSQAWATIPHVTQFAKADIGELEELRKRFSTIVEVSGAKLTITAILLKVVTSVLKAFPQFNASVDTARNEIVYKKYYHLGVAVDTDRGLLVPVIRNVDQKNILELAVELNEVAEKARNKKLTLEDMQGGTFSISNLGGIGGSYFTPIINAPEVAILGVARGEVEPVYKNGQFEPRLRLPLALSYDHRLIDGADGARFLKTLVEHLEQPFLTALQGW